MIDQQDEEPSRSKPAPELQPLRVWAEKAGHLPETFPGDKMHPVKFNRLSWLPRVVCFQLKLTMDSPIAESTYLDTVAGIR